MKKFKSMWMVLGVVLLLSIAGHAFADYREFNMVPVGTVITATGNGSTVDFREYDLQFLQQDTRVFVNCPTVSGTTPSLTVSFQSMVNGVAYTVATGTALTAAGTQTFVVTDQLATNARLSWVVSGTTPSFTCEMWAVKR